VFNNKGLPVRQYEPFFTATPEFEFARAEGVSAVLFYDPPGRVVATLNPDASYAKTTFDSWHQDVWDAADTVLLDPRKDPDVRGYAGRYLAVLAAQPGGWATWYARRIDGELGRAALRGAEQTAAHAGTPTRSWLDTLGRTFLTVAHNRVREDRRLADQFCRIRSKLDIQGNEHEICDALGRAVMRHGFAMLGGQVSHAGMDTGGGQALPDVMGKTVYAHDSRGFVLRTDYDALRRPVRSYVTGPGITGVALQGRTEYGESAVDAEARNLRTRVARQFDGAGIATSSAYDFTGNLLGSIRQFAVEYADDVVDWASDLPLEDREYTAGTSYDALNRPVSMTSPDGSVQIFSYDPAGLLDRLDGRLRGAAATTAFAERIEYNARGQRTLLRYGNGTSTAYSYDPLTFRVTRIVTLLGSRRLQDLRYTYDAVGNPTQVSDRAQQQSFFRNQVVRPSARYTYDALYRLIEATGREHLGQGGDGRPHPEPPGATDAPRTGLPHPCDGTAMSRYTERYTYDEVGNLLLVRHRSADPAHGGWARAYRYEEASLLEPGRFSNRLSSTGPARERPPPRRFGYDEQGNTTSIPQIPLMRWDHADRLHATARQVAQRGVPSTTYYIYDVAGQRVRKVTERAANRGQATRKSERIYVGAFEVYREYGADGTATLERETLHVFSDMRRIALVETRTAGIDRGAGELIRYQFANHLDSSVLELDEAGKVITYEEYYPYGSTSYQAVRASTETPKRYRYTGKERDQETGLSYHGSRYYAPWLGRWTAADPGGMADGPNLYSYARCNPLRMVDLDGKQGSEPEFFDKYTPRFAPSPLLRFDLSADPSAITARFLGDAAVALGTHTEITGPNAGRPDFFSGEARLHSATLRFSLLNYSLSLSAEGEITPNFLSPGSYPGHISAQALITPRLQLGGLDFTASAKTALLRADVSGSLRFSHPPANVPAYAGIAQSLVSSVASGHGLVEAAKGQALAAGGRLDFSGNLYFLGLPITHAWGQLSEVSNISAYGALLAPAGSLFPVTAPLIGGLHARWGANLGYNISGGVLPLISPSAISAGKGAWQEFPTYLYAKAEATAGKLQLGGLKLSGLKLGVEASANLGEVISPSSQPPTWNDLMDELRGTAPTKTPALSAKAYLGGKSWLPARTQGRIAAPWTSIWSNGPRGASRAERVRPIAGGQCRRAARFLRGSDSG
jgi:RHS repeat-associated protein